MRARGGWWHTSFPGAILVGSLLFAPLFWGCTWPLGIHLLTGFLFCGTFAWSAGLLLRRARGTGLPALLLISILALLLQGWTLALNGKCIRDDVRQILLPLRSYCDWLPGSVDQSQSREDMLRLSGLFGATVLSAWIGRSRIWRRRLFWTLSSAGMAVALLGCWQRWTHAPDIFWNPGRQLDFFFATYRNVTNAGEYLNLVLPLSAALALTALVRGRHPGQLAFGIAAAVLTITGSFSCGSKMAPLITTANSLLFLMLNRRELRECVRAHTRAQVGLTALILAGVCGAILASVGLGVAQDRWSRIFQSDGAATLGHRLLVDQACALATPDAGWTGFGPGSFRAIFPFYQGRMGGDLTGAWTYAHNDYAQTMVEWGVIGSAFWSLYFFGGIACLVRATRQAKAWTEDRILARGMLQGLLAIAVMALVDFPLQIASIQVSVAVLLGLGWTSGAWVRAPEGKQTADPARHPEFSLHAPLQGLRCRFVR